MAKVTTKTRVTAKHVAEHRARAGKDLSPKWEGCETWDADTFHRHFVSSMEWYRLEGDRKTFKPAIVKWMEGIGCTSEDIAAFKSLKDSYINPTMGALALCLNRGMQSHRADFNNGKDSAAWLREAIVTAINEGKDDVEEENTAEAKPAGPQVSIQDRVREAAFAMTEEIEDAIESFFENADAFDPKAFKLLNALRGKQAKAAHARIIKEFYTRQHNELVEVATTKDEELKEAYSHLSKANLKKITLFYSEILSACDMLMQEAKINRAPRVKKPTDKTKVVAKMKYLKQDDKMKIVSINPVDIIGASELWVYNTKTRKLGKYVADDLQGPLGVKGTSITGFNESTSVQKTLRKPEDQIKEFKAAGKVALRKFLDDIKAVDIKLNGRINEDTILLKVQ